MRRASGDLDLFMAVARHRGFRRAAAELGLPASSVSDRLRALEEALGTRLLHRTTRSVGLTEAGAALFARLGPALAEVEAALSEAAGGGAPAGTLRLNAPRSAAQLVLPGLLGPFLLAYPGVAVELVVEDGFVDIVAGGFDAGVRFGEALARDVVAVPLGATLRYALVAAPALLAAHGAPRHPRDLAALPAIRHRFPGGNLAAWEFEGQGGEAVAVDPVWRLSCTDPEVAVRAALDGVGLLQTFEGWVAGHVAAGALARLLPDWEPAFPGPWLYYPSRRHPPPALRAFVDWVKAHRSRPGPHGMAAAQH